MNRRWMLLAIAAAMALLLAACGAAPQRAGEPPAATIAAPQSNAGGNVTVQVIPRQLKGGEPAIFEIVMDTHSVELDGDMLVLVEMRDERGGVMKPAAWDGAAAGGHHRAGLVRFGALPAGARAVTLVVKSIGGVSERAFEWNVPS